MNNTISKKTSIGSKFARSLSIVLAGTILFFSLIIVPYNALNSRAELEADLEYHMALSSQGLSSALWQYNDAFVVDFIKSLFLNEKIVYAKVRYEDKMIIEKYRDTDKSKKFILSGSEKAMKVLTAPVHYKNKYVGEISIGISTASIYRDALRNSLIVVLRLFVTVVITFTTVFILTRKHIFTPIQKLEGAAERVSQGNMDVLLSIESNDEIGELSRSLQRMMESIKRITASRDDLDLEIEKRKAYEERIKASLNEKEILIQEIHHRVKNNLSIISGLLSLQSSRVDDQRVKAILMDSENRIQAIATVHESLYLSEDIGNIEIESFISRIFSTVFESYQSEDKRINFKIDAENIKLGTKQVSSLGIVLNELLTNSFKHGFTNKRTGFIQVCIRQNPDFMVQLDYSDNGVGMPVSLDWQNSDSLGLKLIVSIIRSQIGGTIEEISGKGVHFRIAFRIQEATNV